MGFKEDGDFAREDDDPLAALDLQKIRFDPPYPTTLDTPRIAAHGPGPLVR